MTPPTKTPDPAPVGDARPTCASPPRPGAPGAPGHQPPPDIAFVDLGRIPYPDALALQLDAHADVLARRRPPTVFLLEHDPPVITLTPRAAADSARHLRSDPSALRRDGIALAHTDRGGLATYHGPGQLVVYPVLPLDALALNVRRYVCLLEQIVIDTLAAFDVPARRDPAGVGVWVDPPASIAHRPPSMETIDAPDLPTNRRLAIGNPQSQKIAAIGVRVRRWTTLHGLALNVHPNLAHYRHLLPCGLHAPVTSLHQLLAPNPAPVLRDVKQSLIATFKSATAHLTPP